MTPDTIPGMIPEVIAERERNVSHTDVVPCYRPTSSRDVRAIIARAILPPPADAQLGEVTLLPHQRDAVARITRIIADSRGALLADEVGMGKTFVALGVARQYAAVQIIAPAALVPTWRTACTRAGLAHARCYSLHAWSTSNPPSLAAGRPALVIIDEAHHLRNPATKRYRRIADALVDCDVLLVSATPIHNRPQDLHALISLFRGDRADNLTPQMLSQLIVRRRHDERDHTSGRSGAGEPAATPPIRTHKPITIPQDKETLSRILALPSPLPAHDGAVAGALIRLGLLRAWCSSDAQLALALTKRRLRGEALHDALREGRHPTREELRTWVIGDDAGQLAFPELLVTHATESAPLIDVLQKHLDAIAELAQHHAGSAHGDAARVAHLRGLIETHPNVPIVAFSQYTHTISAVFRALSDIAGIGAISGNRARIASGPLPREELLALFAPRASGRPPPPRHLRVRMLLTTDLLAEGVNLQDAGIVVHLDLPWTHALRTQRVGRVARIGSPHSMVHVYRLRPEPAVARALRAERRIAEKRELGSRLIGADSNRRRHRSAADWHSALLARLRGWSVDVEKDTSVMDSQEASRVSIAVVHPTRARSVVALALVIDGNPDHTPALLALTRHARGWRVSRRVRAVCRMLRVLDVRLATERPTERANHTVPEAHEVGRLIAQWSRRARIRRLAGPGPDQLPLVARQLLLRLEQCHRQWSVVRRAQCGPIMAEARHRARHVRGAAADAAGLRWLNAFPDAPGDDRVAWVSGWKSEPALCAPQRIDASESDVHANATLAAVLIGYPSAASDYPSA